VRWQHAEKTCLAVTVKTLHALPSTVSDSCHGTLAFAGPKKAKSVPDVKDIF
jgi:hypothetical protein